MSWTRRGNLMERIDRSLGRIDEEIRLTREEVRLSRKSRDDLHDFIQEQTRRMERAAEHQGRELAKIGTAMDRAIERLDDMGDQIRANTEATWRMLDRLDGGDGAATA
jgi:septal ring factor EnvC (AmiA/AmiB activator)